MKKLIYNGLKFEARQIPTTQEDNWGGIVDRWDLFVDGKKVGRLVEWEKWETVKEYKIVYYITDEKYSNILKYSAIVNNIEWIEEVDVDSAEWLYRKLREIGLSKAHSDAVCELVEQHYEFKR